MQQERANNAASINVPRQALPAQASPCNRYKPSHRIFRLSSVPARVLYRKPRQYEDLTQSPSQTNEPTETRFNAKHWAALAAIVLAVAVQLIWQSLPLAALFGLIVMIAGRAFRFYELDEHIASGISMMGFIAFVMLIAGGYAAVINETGAVNELVQSVVPYLMANKILAATLIVVIGLLVTMGIGTSFGTVPILAVIYVPLCSAVGFSLPATILLMSAAGALGDAGSPALFGIRVYRLLLFTTSR